jgi:aminodeoxyfutalosine synthase
MEDKDFLKLPTFKKVATLCGSKNSGNLPLHHKIYSMPGILTKKIIASSNIDTELAAVAEKVRNGQRITDEDGLLLFEKGSLSFLGSLANSIREKLHGDTTYFNRNFHIEPTNICVFSCNFCSYSRLYAHKEEGWELTTEQMLDIVKSYDGKPVTEVHIVGGVHPKLTMAFFADLLQKIKAHRPGLHIKGFTPVELDYMFRKAKLNTTEGMKLLHEAGLDSLPGGGAEIFIPEIREQICADKVDADGWLAIHEAAHKLGMHSNATMLYGHIEKYRHRIDHMRRLRELQDRSRFSSGQAGGFNTFIPLKFRNKGNDMSHIPESTIVEDMKMYAVARIYLDNFPHIKAYWPMLGRENAQLSLAFGVNDIDGTIDDTTKIYSMAGSEEQNPAMNTAQLVTLIKQAKRKPVERDTLYKVIRDYSQIDIKEIELNPVLN